MSKQGVEVGFGTKVEDLGVVGMVDVCEDSEELAVYVFDCGWELLRKFLTWRTSYELISLMS
jgi:hypothetical protein